MNPDLLIPIIITLVGASTPILIAADENDIIRNALVQRVLRAYEDERPKRKKE